MIRRDGTPRLFGGGVFHVLMARRTQRTERFRIANDSALARAKVEHLAMPAGAASPFFRGVEEFLHGRISARCVQTRAFRASLRAGGPT